MYLPKLQAMFDSANGNPYWAHAEYVLQCLGLSEEEALSQVTQWMFLPGTDWEDEDGATWVTTEGLASLVSGLTLSEWKLAGARKSAFLSDLAMIQ